MSPSKKKDPHFAVFVNCTEDEHAMIHEAAEAAGMARSVSTWCRALLLVEAKRVLKKKEKGL